MGRLKAVAKGVLSAAVYTFAGLGVRAAAGDIDAQPAAAQAATLLAVCGCAVMQGACVAAAVLHLLFHDLIVAAGAGEGD